MTGRPADGVAVQRDRRDDRGVYHCGGGRGVHHRLGANLDERSYRVQRPQPWRSWQIAGEIHRQPLIQQARNHFPPLGRIVDGQGGQIGSQLFRRLEIPDQRDLSLDAHDGSVWLQRLSHYVLSIVVDRPVIRSIHFGQVVPQHHHGLSGKEQASDNQTQVSRQPAGDARVRMVNSAVQDGQQPPTASAHPNRPDEKQRNEKDLDVGHAIDEVERTVGDKGDFGDAASQSPPVEHDETYQSSHETNPAKLLDEQGQVEQEIALDRHRVLEDEAPIT